MRNRVLRPAVAESDLFSAIGSIPRLSWEFFCATGMSRLLRGLAVALLVGLAAGCTPEETVIETGPPEGWEAADGRWWRTGLDTTGVFRDLETLRAMDVSEVIFLATPRRLSAQDQFVRRVRHSLIRLYRNQPEVVDSLFERIVLPKRPRVSASGAMEEQVERAKRMSYKYLRKHFEEPRVALRLGVDVPVPYPDSLRTRQIGGAVQLQVYLDAEGAPVAIKLLDPGHPVLDAIALRATTEMRWRPAYLISKGRWRGIPAWARFTVRFTPD